MFTGLVQEVGTVEAREATAAGAVLRIAADLSSEIEPGDSVAVDGACLTAVETARRSFSAEVMNITLSLTGLGDCAPSDAVNLELAARVGDRLGGHIVQGHVDGTGTVAACTEDGFARRVRVEIPEELRRYVVERGSIALNGVSLTVAGVGDEGFEVSLIPETLERTNLGDLEPGDRVNVECDVVARYVESLIESPVSRVMGDNR